MRHILALALLPLVAVASAQAPRTGDPNRFLLGAQTHFSQGWPSSALAQLRSASIPALRDSAPWARIETSQGRLDFDQPTVAPLRAFCRSGGDVLLTVQPSNPLYEGGQMVSTPEGKEAFGRYVAALVKTFGPCLSAIEVGNEINGPRGLKFAPGVDPLPAYAAVLQTAYRAAKSVNPGVRVLGGSTNAIGTGFLAALFRTGALSAMDGVVIHPYRSHAENVDVEIDRLQAAMRAAGRVVPIWATEFSDNFPTPAEAAPHLIKMTTLMAAGPVQRAYWYALLDQAWFRNMGLFTASGGNKPAAQAMRLVQTRLLPAGRPARIDVGDPDVFLFRFGPRGPLVVWGAPRAITFNGAASARDSVGRPVSTGGLRVGTAPVIVEGATGWQLGPREVLADSLFGYARAPWSYLVDANGERRPLALFDDRFGSYYGAASYRPMRLSDFTAAATGDAIRGARPVLRYTASADLPVTLSACFTRKPGGDGIDVRIERAGQTLRQALLTNRLLVNGLDLDLKRGDTVDLVFARHGGQGSGGFRYDVRLLARGSRVQAECL